jgi:hypothetical protein
MSTEKAANDLQTPGVGRIVDERRWAAASLVLSLAGVTSPKCGEGAASS